MIGIQSAFLSEKAAKLRIRAAVAPRGAALESLRDRAMGMPGRASFRDALRAGDSITVVAEFKRRSPSGGSFGGGREEVGEVVRAYEAGGARALSVLTDRDDFAGSTADLVAAAAASGLPILRKDFIVDPSQVLEARIAGASAVLLIAAILERDEMRALLELCGATGIDALVEVHEEEELASSLECGATIIGVNNRDLGSLTTTLATTEQLAPLVPAHVTLVSESGIRDAEDVVRMRNAGADAVLVGESLLRLERTARHALVQSLASVRR